MMKDLTFWIPGQGYLESIIVPGHYVEKIMLPAAEHEAGHIVAARHYDARILGIGVGFVPELDQRGMFFQALYKSLPNWPTETHCVVKAAGPAADVLYFGGFSDVAARGDLDDIEKLTGIRSLEPYLTSAKEVLTEYAEQITRVATLLRVTLGNAQQRLLGQLPGGRIGSMLVDEAALICCLH